MKRRSQPKTKRIGTYSDKRKTPSRTMYGPVSHKPWNGKTISDFSRGKLTLQDY